MPAPRLFRLYLLRCSVSFAAPAPPQPKSLRFTRMSHELSSLTRSPTGVEHFQSHSFSSVSENAMPTFTSLGFTCALTCNPRFSFLPGVPSGTGWAHYGCSVTTFLFSLSSSSLLALVELGTVAHPELNINSSVWWGKPQRYCWSASDPLLGKQRQVVLGTGSALPTAGLGSAMRCRLTPCICISGFCFLIILSHLKNWLQSFYFLPWPCGRSITDPPHPSFYFANCLAYTHCSAPWTTEGPDAIVMFWPVLSPESQGYIWCPLFPLIC